MRRPHILKYDHRLAKDRPECAALIGEIATAWSRLEVTLAMHFAQIANVSVYFGHGSDHVLAEAVDSVASLPQRIELVLIAARRRFDEATVRDLRKLLNDDIAKTGRLRNKIVHGRWMIADDYPNEVWYTRRFGSNLADLKAYDARKLTTILDSIAGAQVKLDNFFSVELLPKLKALRQ